MATTNPGPGGAGVPVTTVSTADLGAAAIDPGSIPRPEGTTAAPSTNSDPTAGTGVEGELPVWEASYSLRNFTGRILGIVALTVGWFAWANDAGKLNDWHWDSSPHMFFGYVLLALGGYLIVRMLMARYSHYYRLTTRRLFVSQGIFHRRRDMMELLRLKDVYTRQPTLGQRLLGLGTVVVVSSEKDVPMFYLVGVGDPKKVMDLIWHHARSERDQRSVKVDSV